MDVWARFLSQYRRAIRDKTALSTSVFPNKTQLSFLIEYSILHFVENKTRPSEAFCYFSFVSTKHQLPRI